MTEYDIGAAFKAIEEELIASMIRNMDRHRAEEDDEGIQWSQWQAEQLRALEKYKAENEKRYPGQFKKLNKAMESLIQQARETGNMDQEIAILNEIKNGFKGVKKASRGATAEFFRLNNQKLEALIKATTQDMERAEVAVLRMANDQYRKAIFNAQVYANTGAGTYEKAVDMAVKDLLSSGLNCVEYANGARHKLSDYADMAIRTASKRAYLTGEGEKRKEWGITTVIVNKRGNPCPKCLPFCGKVLIDDVWSGGKREDGPYPLMSKAVAAGLYHPRCKDSHTTYFPGISTVDDTWNQKELRKIGQDYHNQQQQQYAEGQAEKYERLAAFALDAENQKKYEKKMEQWKTVAKSAVSDIIGSSNTNEVVGMHQIGKLDTQIYKCITEDIVTDEVIITENQIKHIQDRHPDSFQKSLDNLARALQDPDYIIEDKRRNTGLIIKRLETEEGHTQIVLRICTSEDEDGYKNSIISSWEISEKRLQNYLRNKRILYKKE